MLEHHANAQLPRLRRIAYLHALPLPEHFTAVALGDPVNDLHQRTFARAVFTEQGMDLTRRDAQVDGVVGQTTGVAFADLAQLQARWGRGDGHDRLD